MGITNLAKIVGYSTQPLYIIINTWEISEKQRDKILQSLFERYDELWNALEEASKK
jgi:hypothetical protein